MSFAVDLQPAFILHQRNYRETSILLELLTHEMGRVTLIAKGMRSNRSRWPRGLLQAGIPLLVSWRGKSEIHTLTHVDYNQSPFSTHANHVSVILYLNELLMRLMPKHDTHDDIYHLYAQLVHTLRQPLPFADLAWQLRCFERDILQCLGYGLVLHHTANTQQAIQENSEYIYELDHGPLLCDTPSHALKVSGNALLALYHNKMPSVDILKELKSLLRGILKHHLHGRELLAWQMHTLQNHT